MVRRQYSRNINVPTVLVKKKKFGIRISAFTMISYIAPKSMLYPMKTTVSQDLSRELRTQEYSCAFCDSVWKRLQEGELHSELESLYTEHLKKYHGMTV
jgi:hypothetical protein